MKNSERVILVLGVSRSGTSALTKGLETMGVSLGPSLTLSNPFEEQGLWEDLDFHSLNLKMLNSLGDCRHHTMSLTEEEAATLYEKGFLEEASQLLLKKLPTSQPLGIKDPRFSILLPFWKKIFNKCHVDVSLVIALRNPFSVAASKKQHQEKSFWVWISYLLSCLEHSEGHECLLVDYDELVKNPAHQIKRVADVLRLPIHQELLRAYCDDFIKPSLRHFYERKNSTSNNEFYQEFIMEMYETLLAVAQDQVPFHELKSFLKKWRETFLAAQSLLVLAEKNEYTIQELQQTIQERDQSLHEVHKTINKNAFSIAGFSQTIHQRNLQIAFLTQEQAKRDSEILQLRGQLEK